jgi:hypothetical protein
MAQRVRWAPDVRPCRGEGMAARGIESYFDAIPDHRWFAGAVAAFTAAAAMTLRCARRAGVRQRYRHPFALRRVRDDGPSDGR